MPTKILLLLSLITSTFSYATICGKRDDRVHSYDSKVGRLSNGCTVTMIGRSVAITAGHCVDDNRYKFVEFNVIPSKPNPDTGRGEMRRSNPLDRYEIVKQTMFRKFERIGKDYALFFLERNKYTGKYPGDVQGFYQVDFQYIAQPGDYYRIVGYGTSKIPTMSLTQKVHRGWLVNSDFRQGVLQYRVDTTGGNSGSVIINARTNMIIGIHTNGGCGARISPDQGNHGVYLQGVPELKNKIREYIQWDRTQLR